MATLGTVVITPINMSKLGILVNSNINYLKNAVSPGPLESISLTKPP
jgi:hypothetical protein